MTRRNAPLVIVLALSTLTLDGCFSNDGLTHNPTHLKPVPFWFNLEVASVMTTKKTMFDHVATWVTGEDCSSPRAERSGVYCTRWPDAPLPPQEVYCYSSLAKTNCFAHPYEQGNDRLIGFVPATPPVH